MKSDKTSANALISALPKEAFTKNGVKFFPRENPWKFQDGVVAVHINFDRIASECRALELSLRWTLMSALRGMAPRYAQNLFEAFVHFSQKLQAAGTGCISVGVREIQAFKAQLLPHEQYRVGTLNALLQRWFSLNQPGVDEESIDYLRESRKPGNRKGHAVRTHDPVRGPFTAIEYTLLYRALDQAYGAGELAVWSFVLGRLLFATGARISQYASMKLCDLKVDTTPDGRRTFTVYVPQVKKGDEHSRKQLKPFELSPQTGQLVLDYIEASLAKGAASDAPFFPSNRPSAGAGAFLGHCTGQELSQRFREAIEPHVPTSHRLNGADLPVSPTRFRYTFGTRMAEQGCSRAVIADRLGHSDLQNVEVYFEVSPELAEDIDEALSSSLAPIAQAFHGRLIENGSQATFAGEPGSTIFDFRLAKSGLGSCGTKAYCGFDKPVACYTCFKFEPWLDAPHEKVLHRLIEDRERHRTDKSIATVNDDAIIAVREVISDCAAVRAQRDGGALNA
ncbi:MULTISPECIES: site-specific integrase [Ramlibacter]|uniref:Tyrosine-type recombinase/integrase n=1 Tax=Ramlibacter pinisoli TaxID=2682844 RepID=A0A6N8IPE0_9BURK|nr:MULTISPECIES: site-specific integrase [Ramlibacter]MBA2960696.1 site-specific integrase [Ramlibacter sp. CGMCC 1.13660]MVQ28026.1 tyrosine-type recombinase/integrase [Ramlibacter pinisoli]